MSATHHYLNLAFAHLQIMLVVDIHPLQGAAHPLICFHEEHDCKPTCRIGERGKLNSSVLKEMITENLDV